MQKSHIAGAQYANKLQQLKGETGSSAHVLRSGAVSGVGGQGEGVQTAVRSGAPVSGRGG